jgi:tetratricopeptide (TPR) repeat protein
MRTAPPAGVAGVVLLLVLAPVFPTHVPTCAVRDARAGIELPKELPADSPEIGSVERQALIDFQRDPVANGQALLKLNAGSAKRLPLITLLAAADVHLRAGRTRTATRFFREAARRDAGPPWDTFAQLGLGWTALARRDYAAGAKYYRDIDDAGPLGGIARVMTAWVLALRGRHADAIAGFEAALGTELTPNVRHAALLGTAYARHWRGDFVGAATAFDRLVSPPSVLSDDARYGAAWSRVRAGQTEAALPALVALAGESPAEAAPPRISDAAVSLTPSTVARGGRESTARITGFAGPDARLVAMFDGDGAALARAALGLLDRQGELGARVPVDLPAAMHVPRSEPEAGRGATDTAARAVPAAPRPHPVAEPAARVAESRAPWIGIALMVLVMVVVLLRRGAVGSTTHRR